MTCHHWAVYRLTCAEYEDLRAFAGGKCGICKTPEAQTRRGRIVIDHFHGRHGANFIRGMLCDWCNQSVMQCADGLKAWNPVNRMWEAAAREYEWNPWEKPSPEAIEQMAARRVVPTVPFWQGARHPAEFTAARLAQHAERWGHRLRAAEKQAITTACEALTRVAAEDIQRHGQAS